MSNTIHSPFPTHRMHLSMILVSNHKLSPNSVTRSAIASSRHRILSSSLRLVLRAVISFRAAARRLFA